MGHDGAKETTAAASDADSASASPDGGDEEAPDLGDLLEELDALADLAETPRERGHVRRAKDVALEMAAPAPVFGRVVRGYDRGDVAEAFLGSVLFGVPMFVEGGTQEVGAFVATHPVYLLGTLAFAVAMAVGILYVADIQDVRVTAPLFGFLPRRLVGVVGVAFLTALAAMTAWGRVDWHHPWLALAQVAVAFVPMVIGAALGDILPGS